MTDGWNLASAQSPWERWTPLPPLHPPPTHPALMSLEHVINTPLTADDVAGGGVRARAAHQRTERKPGSCCRDSEAPCDHSPSLSSSSVFCFLVTPQQARSLNPNRDRFVLFIVSLCFQIAANERAVMSENTSEEPPARRWVSAPSAIKGRRCLKEGIGRWLPPPQACRRPGPYGATASLRCFQPA